ncbi:UNVERIFIED_CONTAM: hypothetical protein HDU68_002539, partial [Siphonaria sp. JEL0065]
MKPASSAAEKALTKAMNENFSVSKGYAGNTGNGGYAGNIGNAGNAGNAANAGNTINAGTAGN